MAVLRRWWKNTGNKSRIMVTRCTWKRESSARVTKIKFLQSIAPRIYFQRIRNDSQQRPRVVDNSFGDVLSLRGEFCISTAIKAWRADNERTDDKASGDYKRWVVSRDHRRRIPRIKGEKLLKAEVKIGSLGGPAMHDCYGLVSLDSL